MPEDERMEVEEEKGIEDSEVFAKYQTAGKVASAVLAKLKAECTPGKLAVDLCEFGDKAIVEGLAGFYAKGKVEKGVAFPTCVSVNNCSCHYNPLRSESSVTIALGDLVKIELGVHIDGYTATATQSFIVGADASAPVTGRKADVLAAAYYGAEVALRMLRPGVTNTQVSEALAKVAAEYKCNVVDGLMSHEMKRYVIDGNRVILGKPSIEHRVEEFEFEPNSVFSIDVAFSTGEGKTKEAESRATVFKRAVDQNYLLKMKTSRQVFSEINQKFSVFPFSLRSFESESRARLGIVECLNHGLVHPYPVLFEKEGEFIARFSFTVLITSQSTLRITDVALPPYVKSEYSILDKKLRSTLNQSLKHHGKKPAGSAAPPAAMDTS